MIEPTPDQLRDFFRSDIFQVEKVFEENYDLAVKEFYRRFGWKGIESAPKDGTVFIVASERGEYALAKWVHLKYEKQGFFHAIIGDWVAHYQDDYIDVSDYNYWIPLPEPPKSKDL